MPTQFGLLTTDALLGDLEDILRELRARLQKPIPTEADWAEYGKAVWAARGGWDIPSLSAASERRDGWSPVAERVFVAAQRLKGVWI